MEGSNDARAVRTARNQALFRSVNEKVKEVNEPFDDPVEGADYLCECALEDCRERVTLTADDYEAVRRVPTHFFVKAHHFFPDFERVVAEPDGYVIVEKFGVAGAEAVALARETTQAEASGGEPS